MRKFLHQIMVKTTLRKMAGSDQQTADLPTRAGLTGGIRIRNAGSPASPCQAAIAIPISAPPAGIQKIRSNKCWTRL